MTEDAYAVVYYVTFAVVALGSWLFMRKLPPARKYYWMPRVNAIGIAVLGPFFIVPLLLNRQFGAAVVFALALVFIGYVSVAVVRVCKSCGHVAQPENLLAPAAFCPKCGTQLVAPRLSGGCDE